MIFRSVGDRCAIDLDEMSAATTGKDVLAILFRRGFKLVDNVDPSSTGRPLIGRSVFKYGAKMSEAPHSLDCSSFTKWLYAQRGIWIPRLSIQQSECGEEVASLSEMEAGDLVFTTGFRRVQRFTADPSRGIGHVSIATSKESVLCATDSELGNGIVELSVIMLLKTRTIRAVRRLIPQEHRIMTLEIPSHREIETSDDVKWLILQSL